MPKNKKPQRPYRQRATLKPLNMRDPWRIEGQAHAALMAVNGGAVTEDTTTSIAAHADIVRLIAERAGDKAAFTHAEGVMRVVCAMQLRGQAGAGFAPTDLETATLRASIGYTSEWLAGRKNKEILDAAMASLRSLETLGGVRVRL